MFCKLKNFLFIFIIILMSGCSAKTPYEIFSDADNNFKNSDSFTVKSVLKTTLFNEEKENSSVQEYLIKKVGLNDNIIIDANISNKSLSESNSIKIYYNDGYVYYKNGDLKTKNNLNLDEFSKVIHLNPVVLTENIIEKSEYIKENNTLNFILNGDKTTKILKESFGKNFSFLSDNMTISSAEVNAKLNSDNFLENYSLNLEGNISVDDLILNVKIEYSMDIYDFNNTKVIFPDDLDDYKIK